MTSSTLTAARLLALSAHYYGDNDKARTLVQNLENGVKRDTRPDRSIIQRGGAGEADHQMATAHWGEDGFYWRWSEGGVEATSFALRALLTIDPKNHTGRAGDELAHQEPSWSAVEQYPRHGHHDLGSQRLSSPERRIKSRPRIRIAR